MRNLKSFTSKEMHLSLRFTGPVWQTRFFDSIVRDEKHFSEVLDYIHENPLKAGIVSTLDRFEFSSYRAYARLGERVLAIDLPDGSRLGP